MRISTFLFCLSALLLSACVETPPTAEPQAVPVSVPAEPGQLQPAKSPPGAVLNEAPFYVEIRGSVRYRTAVRLTPNFFCLVRLMDLGAWDSRGAPEEIDRTILPGPLSLPMPYSVAMEGHLVNPQHSYVLEAFIFVPDNPQNPDPAKGTILFRNRQPVPVLTRGNSALADIEMGMQR